MIFAGLGIFFGIRKYRNNRSVEVNGDAEINERILREEYDAPPPYNVGIKNYLTLFLTSSLSVKLTLKHILTKPPINYYKNKVKKIFY